MDVRRFQHYIDGEWVGASGGKLIDSINPATGEVWARFQDGTAEDVDRAVAAARRAFDETDWSSHLMGPERAEILRRISRGMMERLDELSELESIDSGKPIMESSIVDIPMASECFSYYADWAPRIGGDVVPLAAQALDLTVREPVGVCGAIIPWNFPLLIATWKMAPALAAGCTVVLKPSEMTSASVLVLMEVFEAAGIPHGVANIVTGYGPTVGSAICEHSDVDKVSFTGSTSTGKAIVRLCAGTMKEVTTELGGKNPLLIFDDANLDKAMSAALVGGYLNQGEACIASSRLILQEGIHDQFVEQMVERVRKIKVGPPLDYDTRLGALISKDHLDKVESYIKLGQEEGARLLTGGERLTGGELGNGYYLTPAVFDGVTQDMRIAQEEIFGPVVGVMKFSDEEEGIRIANQTIFGLVGAVFTQDINRAFRVARRIRSGTVWVNAYGYLKTEAPFGGYKQSGTGRDLSEHALGHYTQLKNLYVDLDDEQICFYE